MSILHPALHPVLHVQGLDIRERMTTILAEAGCRTAGPRHAGRASSPWRLALLPAALLTGALCLFAAGLAEASHPSFLSASAGSNTGEMVVRWNNPFFNDSLRIRWRVKGPPAGNWTTTGRFPRTTLSHTISNLEDKVYDVEVSPSASFSQHVASTTGRPLPAPPTAGAGVWSATLTPRNVANSGNLGCNNTASGNHKCSDATTLSDDDFDYRGRSYAINVLTLNSAGELSLWLTNYLPAYARRDLVLTVGSAELPLADFGGSGGAYGKQNSGLTWTENTAVTVGLKQFQTSSNANLSALTAKSATSATGTFSALALTPSTFSASTTAYTASVANSVTHVKLTPTRAHRGASIKVGKGTSLTAVTSGSDSQAIALSVGSNEIKVEVTAQDGTTKDYTVTVTRATSTVRIPEGVNNVQVTPGDRKLTPSWDAPRVYPSLTVGVAATRYELYWHESTATNPGWSGNHVVTITGNPPATTYEITGLTNGTEYFVWIRACNSDGCGNALVAAGTPQAATTPTTPTTPTVSVSASPNPVTEGSSVTVTATLSEALSSNVSIPISVTRGTAESGDIGTLTSIAISSGQTSGTGTITTAQDTDTDNETFTVALGSPLPSSVAAGSPNSVTVVITDDDALTGPILTGLTLSVGGNAVTLDPGFGGGTTQYAAKVPSTATSVTVTPAWTGGHSALWTSIEYPSKTAIADGLFSGSGASASLPLASSGATAVTVFLTTADFSGTRIYTVIITPVQPLPDAPVGLDLVSGDAVLQASWSAPVNTGTTAILRYEVQRKRASAADWPAGDTDVNGLTATVGGLTNDAAYHVRVRAVNSAGAGPWTAAAVGTPSALNRPTSVTLNSTAGTTIYPGIPFTLTATLDRPALTDTRCVVSWPVGGSTYTRTLVIAAGEMSEGFTSRTLFGTRDVILVYTVDCAALNLSDTWRLTIRHRRVVSLFTSAIVMEGGPVTVAVLLSARLESDATIPLTLTAGTAESGDYGSLSPASITIPAGKIIGKATIPTAQDTDIDDETFTVALGSPLPANVVTVSQAVAENRESPYANSLVEEFYRARYADFPESSTVTIRDDDKPPVTAPRELAVEAKDRGLALTWKAPFGPPPAHYTVGWKASSAGDSSWVYKDRIRALAHTVTGLSNGTTYDVRVRRVLIADGGGWDNGAWAVGTGTPASVPLTLTLSADSRSIASGGSVAVTARLGAPAASATEVWFDTAGDGGAARWGPSCDWEHGTSDLIARGEREATVKLCATAGVAMTVTAGIAGTKVEAAGIRVRALGPNPPTALSVHADPQAVAAGGTVTVTARLDRPSAPGMTVHLHLNGVGAASWGACGGTAAARTLPSPLAGLATVEIPPGGREATAELCVLWEAGPRLELGAYAYAPRLDAPNLALPGPGGLGLRALTVTSPDPEQRVAQGEVALEAQSSSYELRVPVEVDRVTVKPAAKYASAAVKVNGQPVDSGTPAVDVPLKEGENPIVIEVRVPAVPAVRKYTLTVVRGDAAKETEPERLAQPEPAVVPGPECVAEAGPLCGIVLSAGSEAVELSPAFSPEVTSYRASVPAGTANVTLAPSWGGEASVFAGSRRGGTSFTRPVRVRPSGTAVELALAPDGGRTELWVMVRGGPGSLTTYAIEAVEAQARVRVREEPARSSDASLSGLEASTSEDGAAFDGALALSPAFSPAVTAYAASVAHGVAHARLTPAANDAGAAVKAGRAGSLAAVARGEASGAIALAVGANAIEVEVTAADGTKKTYAVTVERAGPPLTAAFEGAPSEHDGAAPFGLNVRFSEAPGAGGAAPSAASFRVRGGQARSAERVEAGLWRVRVKPGSWRDVTVTLKPPPGCAEEGAVCASGGRALANAPSATVGGPVRVRLAGGRAREGRDASLDFAVTLSREAAHEVSVDYATADGTATAGEDYEAASGTLVFAPGETAKTVSVAILDDAVDEGKEKFRLGLSNPKGAYLRGIHREAAGVIANQDPLQRAWLARFGRAAAGHLTDAVSGRLADGLAPGTRATLAGQALDLSRTDDARALAEAVTGLARAFGAREAANDGDPFARRGLGGGAWDAPTAASAPARSVTGRDLLLGSSFHLASKGGGRGPGLAAWGRAAHGRFDGEEASDRGPMGIDGEVLTGMLGVDAEWDRVLAGIAVSLSEGEGRFDDPGVDKGRVESRMTTVSPYAKVKLTGRVSAWSLAGRGTGSMTITQEARTNPVRAAKATRADLSMRVGAVGARGALLTPERNRGMDLSLRADAFFLRMESEKAPDSAGTEADASRVRLVLEGGRAFEMSETATLRPSLELGVRHDGGDAETGTGFELGGGVSYRDTASGLSVEARARMLVAHADSEYEEWGASATVRLDPGERGRGLSFSLSPTVGAASSATERLWGARDALSLAPDGGEFEAARSLRGEMGYGVALFGGRFTGTPNAGFGLSDTAREFRMGWRLASAVRDGFELNIDATRREAADSGEPAEHRAMLSATIRW